MVNLMKKTLENKQYHNWNKNYKILKEEKKRNKIILDS